MALSVEIPQNARIAAAKAQSQRVYISGFSGQHFVRVRP
jgi:hypothetical protein